MPEPQKNNHSVRNGLIGITVSIATLWLTLRGIDYTRLLDTLPQISFITILLLVVVNLLFIFVRAYRWQWLLRQMKPLPTVQVYHLTQIGALVNNLLPLRIGEVVRAILLKRRFGFSGAQAFGNILLEQMINLIALMLMLIVAISFGNLPDKFLGYARYSVIILAVIVIAVLLFLKLHRWKFSKPDEIHRKGIGGLIERVTVGLNGIYQWRISIPALLLTFIMWLISAATFLVFAKDFPNAISLPEAISVSVFIAIGGTIPAAPGAVGTYHLACKLGLMAYGMPVEQAVIIAFLTHIISYLCNNLTGLISMLAFKLRWHDLLNLRKEEM